MRHELNVHELNVHELNVHELNVHELNVHELNVHEVQRGDAMGWSNHSLSKAGKFVRGTATLRG